MRRNSEEDLTVEAVAVPLGHVLEASIEIDVQLQCRHQCQILLKTKQTNHIPGRLHIFDIPEAWQALPRIAKSKKIYIGQWSGYPYFCPRTHHPVEFAPPVSPAIIDTVPNDTAVVAS